MIKVNKKVIAFSMTLVMAMPAVVYGGSDVAVYSKEELKNVVTEQVMSCLSGVFSTYEKEFKDLCKPSDSTPVPPEAEKPEEDNTTVSGQAEKMLSIVNAERKKQGISALKMNTKLSLVATKKAEDMRDKNYFSHTSPTYGSPFEMMKQFGISYTKAGENIAKGYQTPEDVMTGWMNSSGHKENILDNGYTELGVGYCTDKSGTGYWVQMFIRP